MGVSNVKQATQADIRRSEKQLLTDIRKMEQMLADGVFDDSDTKIGAEQEFCLVDKYGKAAPASSELRAAIADPDFTSELAKFNVEFNIDPLPFSGTCLSDMENVVQTKMARAREAASSMGLLAVMVGILPTIRKRDVTDESRTDEERYKALCDAIEGARGKQYQLQVTGIDELNVRHDSAMLEAANTGFQVHLQVHPSEFVSMYNIAQTITAPVLAAATNSPILFYKRLWRETRIALFQQSVDIRRSTDHLREKMARVTFGNDWLRHSVMDIYREDVVRHRVLLAPEGSGDDLFTLQVHNGTVYRWNRPCFGVNGGKGHLRIENRVLPSGPTVLDEIANAAFWLGLMNGAKHKEEYQNLPGSREFTFSDALSNFTSAARMGLDTSFTWLDGKAIPAQQLILEQLVPLAEEGLQRASVAQVDIDRYLGVIRDRVISMKTGSRWILQSYKNLIRDASEEEVFSAITVATVENQASEKPVHEWDLATLEHMKDWEPAQLLVEECMTKDLFTVHSDDIVALAADMMDWKKIRYVPVEDQQGMLRGLLTSRRLLRDYNRKINHHKEKLPRTVEQAMIPYDIDPSKSQLLTIDPDKGVMEAMKIMEDNQVGCLPVVREGRLVGIITEQDFLRLTSRLLKRLSNNKAKG